MDQTLIGEWRRLQVSNPDLASPYFCPEFTACVASARDDVEVAVCREGAETVGVFPYQREQARVGMPVGHPLSDYHGLICAPRFRVDPRAILKACSLRTWRYNHLPEAQTVFRRYHSSTALSPVMDLAQGFDRYVEAVKRQSSELSNALRKGRNLVRDHGPLSFAYHVGERPLLDTLIRWKSDQYRRTGVEDRFALPWFRQVVENVFHCQTERFSGVLSVLRAGADPVALHFGMRARNVWHYWFPAYDPQYAAYSPGILLLLKMAEAAPGLGIDRIDLGKGDAVRYKEALKSYDVPLAIGCVELPSPRYYARQIKKRLRGLRNGYSRRWIRGHVA